MAQKMNNKESVNNSVEYHVNSSKRLINFHNMVFRIWYTNHFWHQSFMMVVNHKRVSQKVYRTVQITSYKVFLYMVVDHKQIQQKVAAEKKVSYKSIDRELVLIISHKVFPSKVADHNKDPVAGHKLVSFELNAFNCQDFNKQDFELALEISILKKELFIVDTHLVDRVDFEICLLDLNNNFVEVFNFMMTGRVFYIPDLVDNFKAEDIYFMDNSNFLGCLWVIN